jgi:hypothetical protein
MLAANALSERQFLENSFGRKKKYTYLCRRFGDAGELLLGIKGNQV